jgi:hypothetical protein
MIVRRAEADGRHFAMVPASSLGESDWRLVAVNALD